MSDYLFKELDYESDPYWVVKAFFNSINLSDSLSWAIPHILNRSGLVDDEAYCHFPDFSGPDPEFHFEGVMFGLMDDEVIVSEDVCFEHLNQAIEMYKKLHPEKQEEIDALVEKNARKDDIK
jgi:CDI immunity protein